MSEDVGENSSVGLHKFHCTCTYHRGDFFQLFSWFRLFSFVKKSRKLQDIVGIGKQWFQLFFFDVQLFYFLNQDHPCCIKVDHQSLHFLYHNNLQYVFFCLNQFLVKKLNFYYFFFFFYFVGETIPIDIKLLKGERGEKGSPGLTGATGRDGLPGMKGTRGKILIWTMKVKVKYR